jgi:hypothetical protein
VLLNSDQKVFGSMKQNCASLDGSKGIDLRNAYWLLSVISTPILQISACVANSQNTLSQVSKLVRIEIFAQ